MARKQILLSCALLVGLAGDALASLQLEDSDAVMEIILKEVNIPTKPEALTTLFLFKEGVIWTTELNAPGDSNTAPVLQSLQNQNVSVGNPLNLQLQATDRNGDNLTYSATDLPSGATLSGNSFTWTPAETQTGTHQITFIVSDGRGGTDSQTIQIEVKGSSDPPSSLGDLDGYEQVSSGDAILALRFAAGLGVPTEDQKTAADIDRDGSITSGDAILILRKAAGLIESFSKPAAIDAPLAMVDVRLEESANPSALTLTLELAEGTAGGDLSLTLGADLEPSGDILLQELSPKALTVTNTSRQGEIRTSFIDPGREEKPRPLSLIVPVKNLEPETPIALRGILYTRQGRPAGEVRFERAAAHPLPTLFALHQNQPNPFNPSTIISYQLPAPGDVLLNVYSITGQHIKTLVDGPAAAGYRTAMWDGTDEQGRRVGSGVYLYRISIAGERFMECKRMILLR